MSYELVHKLSDEQILDLHRLYQSEWWSTGRTPAETKKVVENSDLIFGLCQSDTKRLIAFARVLTDFVFKALIFDVIVSAQYRDKALGKAIVEAILAHPDLREVQHLELYCLPELVPFYQKWGFTDDLGKLIYMRRTRP